MKRKNKGPVFNFVLLRYFVVGILVLFLLAAAGQAVWTHLRNSHLFKIKTVVVSDSGMQFIKASRLVNLKGRNIFALDLKPLTDRLQAQYPEIAEIKLLKRFPDQIVVMTKKRTAFARARIRNKDITIDAQGVILSLDSSVSSPDLPWIAGIDLEKTWSVPGRQLQGQDIKTALALIKAFRLNKYLSVYKVLKIDVANLSQIEFYTVFSKNHGSPFIDGQISMTDTLKVIVDQNNIFEKIQMLSLMLSQAKLKLDEINYIDLRFKEPIIGKKMGNSK